MKLPWRFQEHLPCCVNPLRFVPDFRTNLALEDIGNGNSRVAVRRRTLARRIRNFHSTDGPILQCKVGHIVLEDNFGATSALRVEHLSKKKPCGALHQYSASDHANLRNLRVNSLGFSDAAAPSEPYRSTDYKRTSKKKHGNLR